MEKEVLDKIRKNVDILDRYIVSNEYNISYTAFGVAEIGSEEINAIEELVEILNKELL